MADEGERVDMTASTSEAVRMRMDDGGGDGDVVVLG